MSYLIENGLLFLGRDEVWNVVHGLRNVEDPV